MLTWKMLLGAWSNVYQKTEDDNTVAYFHFFRQKLDPKLQEASIFQASIFSQGTWPLV